MSAKKLATLFSIVIFSTCAYAQKGAGGAVRKVLQKNAYNRAKLPHVKDGLANLISRRLMGQKVAHVPVLESLQHNSHGLYVTAPTASVIDFKTALQNQHSRPASSVRLEDRYGSASDFYVNVQPGSGKIRGIALPAGGLIEQAAQLSNVPAEEMPALTKMADVLDHSFIMTTKGDWILTTRGSFEQVHRLIAHFKDQWPTYSKAYGGTGQPLTRGLAAALDVLDIQTWMLENEGAFPQSLENEGERSLIWKFEALMDRVAKDTAFAQDPAIQAVVNHLIYLRIAADASLTPTEVINMVLTRVDNGGRVPGSSLERVTPEEEVLTRELNYLEQLRRANLLRMVVPMERTAQAVALRLGDFQEQGHIYQQMIKIIPEFAYDQSTLNVPTRSYQGWQKALQEWQKKRRAAGLDTEPRTVILGRYSLPLNFNDLTPQEQEEVLLGTFLRIKDK